MISPIRSIRVEPSVLDASPSAVVFKRALAVAAFLKAVEV